MLSLGTWGEILIIAIVALIVVKPQDWPKILRTLGRWMGTLRRLSIEWQHEISTLIEDHELDQSKPPESKPRRKKPKKAPPHE